MYGETIALITACCWAVAARLFRLLGASFSPLSLNLWKGLVAIVFLAPMAWWAGGIDTLSHSHIFWLLLSGVIGIGLGDTFFFQALNRIGDSQSILMAESLAPIFTALLAMAWIAEWLTWQQWCGIAVVILAVDMVIKLNKRDQASVFEPSGYVFAALAALCQAVGAVISRDVLTNSGVDAANASLMRLLGGLGIIVILLVLRGQRWMPITHTPLKTWSLFALATLVGTFAALYLQMIAFTHAKAAVVQTLFATSVILSLLVARVLGEPVNRKSVLWSLVAFAGVGLLVFGESF